MEQGTYRASMGHGSGRVPSARIAPLTLYHDQHDHENVRDQHDHAHIDHGCSRHSGIHIYPEHRDRDHGLEENVPTTLEAAYSHSKPIPSHLDGKLPTSSRVAATHRGWLTVYKRLFLLSFLLNLSLFSASASGHFPSARANSALFSVANVLVLVLCRSELFLRILFALSVFVLRRALPFAPLRSACTALLSSLGGIHSGCGLSSVLWLAYAVSSMFQHSPWSTINDGGGGGSDHETADSSIPWLQRAAAAATLALLVITCLAAFPALRHLHHNVFERVHRLAGWAALAGVWLYSILSAGAYEPDGAFHLRASHVARSPAVWATTAITMLIVFPWLSVRRMPVCCHAAATAPPPARASVSILHFFSSSPVRPGLLARISRSPLSEWHAFGTVSDGVHGYMIVAGAVGDFTNRLVEEPPTHLWVRTLHFAGIPYLTNMYERALHVATGSGIGVFLSFLLQETTTEVHLLWVVKSVDKAYPEVFAELTRRCRADRLTVYDTAERGGRPDVGAMAVEAGRRVGAQVVIVTSNPSGSKAVVDACHANGFAAFGPVWDS